jgi:hypothetical protein
MPRCFRCVVSFALHPLRLGLLSFALLPATPAFAQQNERLPPLVLDVRGAIATLKQSTTTAASLSGLTSLQIVPQDLPAHALGLSGGVHFYPVRLENFAFGIGGDLLLEHASQQQTDSKGAPTGVEVDRRLQSVSGQITLNFGHRQGWSYLTVGLGQVAFDTYLKDDVPDGLRPMTINFGGGARWFNVDHVALNLDLRFYQTKPAIATAVVGARVRQSVMVFSAGISVK